MIAQFRSFSPDYAYFLASDPVVKVLQALAYREMLYNSLLNERARATLLAFARGVDLDRLGDFYGVTRMVVQEEDLSTTPPTPAIMETDARLRTRIQDAIVAISSAGPAEHYRFYAMTSDIRVKDVVVYSPDLPNFINMGGRVSIAVLSVEGDGTPSLDLLGVVRTAVTNRRVKMVSDIVVVEPAARRTIDVTADILLEADVPSAVFSGLEAELRSKFAERQKLGWDVPRSWIIKSLMVEGVNTVDLTLPAVNLTVQPNQFPQLGTVSLRFAGFAVDEDWVPEDQLLRQTYNRVHEYYISFAITNQKTASQIQADLTLAPQTGIVRPTLSGLADYLGIPGIRTVTGQLRPADEIAFMIHYILTDYYARGHRP